MNIHKAASLFIKRLAYTGHTITMELDRDFEFSTEDGGIHLFMIDPTTKAVDEHETPLDCFGTIQFNYYPVLMKKETKTSPETIKSYIKEAMDNNDDKVSLSVLAEITGEIDPYVPGKILGPPENCYPDEGGCASVLSAKVGDMDINLTDEEEENARHDLYASWEKNGPSDYEPPDDGPPSSY